eukprot:jgi/Mesvir1/20092/Mv13336-RA.1
MDEHETKFAQDEAPAGEAVANAASAVAAKVVGSVEAAGATVSAGLKSVMKKDSPKQDMRAALGSGFAADVFLWKNPVLTGSFLAGTFLIYLAFHVMDVTFLTLTSSVSLLGVLVVFVWSHAAHLLKRPPPAIPRIRVSEGDVDTIARRISCQMNRGFDTMHKMTTGKDVVSTAKVAFLLYVVSRVGGWMSLTTLVFIVALSLFTLPKAYMTYHRQIDQAIDQASAQLHKGYAVVDEKVLRKLPMRHRKTA